MTERIRLIHQTSDYTYGRHRIRAELVDMGAVVNLKRIERLMRLAGLRAGSAGDVAGASLPGRAHPSGQHPIWSGGNLQL